MTTLLEPKSLPELQLKIRHATRMLLVGVSPEIYNKYHKHYVPPDSRELTL